MSTRRLCAVIALAATVSVPLATAASQPGGPHAHAAAAPVKVAVVESASPNLSVMRKATGKVVRLNTGDTIYFDEVVHAGPGASGKFKVTVPKGHSPDEELLFIKPTGGAHPTTTLRGTGNITEVTLRP